MRRVAANHGSQANHRGETAGSSEDLGGQGQFKRAGNAVGFDPVGGDAQSLQTAHATGKKTVHNWAIESGGNNGEAGVFRQRVLDGARRAAAHGEERKLATRKRKAQLLINLRLSSWKCSASADDCCRCFSSRAWRWCSRRLPTAGARCCCTRGVGRRLIRWRRRRWRRFRAV